MFIPWWIREKTTQFDMDEHFAGDELLELKPEVVECMLKRLPSGTTIESFARATMFELVPGGEVFVVFNSNGVPERLRNKRDLSDADFGIGDPENDEPLTMDDLLDSTDMVYGADRSSVEKVFNALKQCASEPMKASTLQKAVATREGKKSLRAMLGWQGPGKKELPSELATKIAKMSANKKVDGGRRKTRKGRKTHKKTRRATKRS